MANFNFNELAETSFVSNSQNYLKPYDVYKVKLTKMERSTLNKKDGTATYNTIALEFTGDDGIFQQNIFIPDENNEKDFERRENEKSHKLMASRFDQYKYTLMQIVEAVNPKGAENIKANGSKLEKVEKPIALFTDMILKAAAAGKNTEVYLKLVGQNTDGRIFARLPNACLIGNDGKPAALNFINADKNKLRFSNYEITEMNKYKSAAPTPIEEEKTDEFNLDDLEV